MTASKPAGVVVNFDESVHKWESIVNQKRTVYSLKYDHEKKKLEILDQLLLPHKTEYKPVESISDAYSVIKNMQVRGAPLIATVATLAIGIQLDTSKAEVLPYNEVVTLIEQYSEKLLSSRPTAVNLRNALDAIRDLVLKDQREEIKVAGRLTRSIQSAVYQWYLDETAENDRLLRNATICVEGNKAEGKLTVMTICNTGSCATSSQGTALGVIRQLYLRNKLELAIVLETRPYNQGSRLTAYELLTENVPFVLISDSMAAAAMKKYTVDAVLVGADQVALNGDTANKIGTYMLAVLSNFHRVPFYVVTPVTSINRHRSNGDSIEIEERPPAELITLNERLIAPENTPVWNPAFDVTPGSLITGVLTDLGNAEPSKVASLFE